MSTNAEAVAADSIAEAKRVFHTQRNHRWIAKQTTAQERKAVLERLRAAVVSRFDEVIDDLDDELGRPPGLSHAGTTAVSVAPGAPDDLVVAPTVLTDVDADAAVMQEEIVGPVLPVMTYRELPTVVESIRQHGKPLAMYIFSESDAVVEKLLAETSSGGATVDSWALHSSDTSLPFGGVGASGIGRYHGIHGFRELSHARSIFVAAPGRD